MENAHPINGPGWATCRECVGIQTVELTCIVCDKAKCLEEFAKNQRRDRDNARCLACVQIHGETDPVTDENKMIEVDSSTTTGLSVTSSQIGGESIIFSATQCRTALQSPKYAGSASSFAIDDIDEFEPDNSLGGGVWISSDRAGKGLVLGGSGIELPSHGPQGIARRRQSDGTASIHSEWSKWGIDVNKPPLSSDSRRLPPLRKESKFAKVRSAAAVKTQAPSMRLPESTGTSVNMYEEEVEECGDISNYI